jgi:hypothetical protein
MLRMNEISVAFTFVTREKFARHSCLCAIIFLFAEISYVESLCVGL